MENNKKFPIYPFLYAFSLLAFIAIVFLWINLGVMERAAGAAFFLVIVLMGYLSFLVIGFLGLLFYLINYSFYVRKEYPHSSDNLILNSLFNFGIIGFLILLAGFNASFLFLIILPVMNLILNISFIKKTNSHEPEALIADKTGTNKIFPLYPILYTFLALIIGIIVLGIICSMYTYTHIVSDIINSFSSLLIMSLFISVIIFYFINFTFFIKEEYPSKSDNLIINSVINILVLAVLILFRFYILLILPVFNLILNFEKRNRKTIK
ncbi:MAG: hypothetical protein WCX74_04295 [Candidatus Paceibacterota bacterium]